MRSRNIAVLSLASNCETSSAVAPSPTISIRRSMILRQTFATGHGSSGLQRDPVSSKFLRGLQSVDDKRVSERRSQVSGRYRTERDEDRGV